VSFYKAIKYLLSPFVMVHPVVEKKVMPEINQLSIAKAQS
jgi:hypothetical protein